MTGLTLINMLAGSRQTPDVKERASVAHHMQPMYTTPVPRGLESLAAGRLYVHVLYINPNSSNSTSWLHVCIY